MHIILHLSLFWTTSLLPREFKASQWQIKFVKSFWKIFSVHIPIFLKKIIKKIENLTIILPPWNHAKSVDLTLSCWTVRGAHCMPSAAQSYALHKSSVLRRGISPKNYLILAMLENFSKSTANYRQKDKNQQFSLRSFWIFIS